MTHFTTLVSAIVLGFSTTTAFAADSSVDLAGGASDIDLTTSVNNTDIATRGPRGRSSGSRGSTGGRRTTSSRSTSRTTRGPSGQSRTTSRTSRTTTARPAPSSRPTTSRPTSPRPTTSRPTTGRPTTSRPTTGRPTTGRPPTGRPVATGRPTARPAVVTSGGVRPRVVPRPRYTNTFGYRPGYVHYTNVRPYHGVFVYGPRPVTHVRYVGGGGGGGAQVSQRDLPNRALDRGNSVAVGLTMGSLHSAFESTDGCGDLGIGIAGRYRPTEALGLQLDLKHHGAGFDPEVSRNQTLVSGSVQLFAFPWSRVQPYVVGGVTQANRNIEQPITKFDGSEDYVSQRDNALGLHGGVGLEIGIGKSLALDLEARYLGYLGQNDEAQTLGGAVTTTAGLMVHF